ncbi:MAG: hypothetical protein M3O71_10700 [Bacteroidota bacterium]|nr:hypothetical protein [Bacteroidota bacterium]
MFKKLQNQIPNTEPDLQIGPLSLWVSGYTYINQAGQGDLAYLKTPILLETENVAVFSGMSETPVFCIREVLNGLVTMYETISIKQIVKFESNDSEFSLELKNDFGQIKLFIEYNSWVHSGSLEFEDKIDQSYLPKIIRDLEKIIERFT